MELLQRRVKRVKRFGRVEFTQRSEKDEAWRARRVRYRTVTGEDTIGLPILKSLSNEWGKIEVEADDF